jgi:hypothetical protein
LTKIFNQYSESMTYIQYSKIILLFSVLVFSNCQNTEGSNSTTKNTVDSTTQVQAIVDRPVQNFTIVPFQQVGNITAAMTETDLKQLLGDSNVVRINRGAVQTVVFPNSPNELEIAWKKGEKFKKIGSIIIRKGNWRTPEGIGIGSTKKELEAINGKSVTLFQLDEEDFRVVWNGGKVNEKLAVTYSSATDRVFEMIILF